MHRRALVSGLLAMALAIAGGPASAQGLENPVGRWKTVDDRTGKPRGVVRIVEEGGRLIGRIESGFDPAERERVCSLCTDERRGQRLQGMVILRDLRPDGNEWTGGDILDPDNGTVYRCKLRLEDGGRKLVVRGYVGVSLFGRSQIWERMP